LKWISGVEARGDVIETSIDMVLTPLIYNERISRENELNYIT